MLSETIDVGIINILRTDPREAEPMDKVLGGGHQHASVVPAVAEGD